MAVSQSPLGLTFGVVSPPPPPPPASSLSSLPDEILERIISFLPHHDFERQLDPYEEIPWYEKLRSLQALRCTSRRLDRIVRPRLWGSIDLGQYGGEGSDHPSDVEALLQLSHVHHLIKHVMVHIYEDIEVARHWPLELLRRLGSLNSLALLQDPRWLDGDTTGDTPEVPDALIHFANTNPQLRRLTLTLFGAPGMSEEDVRFANPKVRSVQVVEVTPELRSWWEPTPILFEQFPKMEIFDWCSSLTAQQLRTVFLPRLEQLRELPPFFDAVDGEDLLAELTASELEVYPLQRLGMFASPLTLSMDPSNRTLGHRLLELLKECRSLRSIALLGCFIPLEANLVAPVLPFVLPHVKELRIDFDGYATEELASFLPRIGPSFPNLIRLTLSAANELCGAWDSVVHPALLRQKSGEVKDELVKGLLHGNAEIWLPNYRRLFRRDHETGVWEAIVGVDGLKADGRDWTTG